MVIRALPRLIENFGTTARVDAVRRSQRRSAPAPTGWLVKINGGELWLMSMVSKDGQLIIYGNNIAILIITVIWSVWLIRMVDDV